MSEQVGRPRVAHVPAEPERELGLVGIASTLAVAVPVVAGGAVLGGLAGAMSAGMAVLMVLAMFAVSAVVLRLCVRLRRATFVTFALGTMLVRFGVFGALLVMLDASRGLDRRVLAMATVILLAATLASETVWVRRHPSLFWLDLSMRERTRV